MAELTEMPVPEIRVREYLETDNDRLVMAILWIIVPPMAVFFKCRGCSKHVLLNLFLYFIFILPAHNHAAWFCFVRGREQEAIDGVARARLPQV